MFELTSDDPSCFMTMELIEGGSLAALLREWPTSPNARKRTILAVLRADALNYAHRHDIVHGDFKPATCSWTVSTTTKMSTSAQRAQRPREDTRIPRRNARLRKSASARAVRRPERRDDVFSFACVAYEVLTGQHPFQRRSSLEVRAQPMDPARAWNLSAPQWLALLSALAWDREQRPAEIDSLMEALVPAKTDTHKKPRQPPRPPY